MADKSAGPTPDDIMSATEMKPILMKSKQEPVSCVIGTTEDKEGVVLLHKKSKPKKLMTTLKAQAAKIKLRLDNGSLRFGMAEVDTEIDAALVRFRINKTPPGGIEMRIRNHIKRSGFTKVEIVVDESLNEEPEDEADADGAASADATPDWQHLTTALAEHIGKIQATAGGDPMLIRPLAKLAGQASEQVKAKLDFAAASDLVEQLARALTTAGDQAKLTERAAAGPSPVTYAKSRLAWLATRKKIEGDLKRLEAEIMECYGDEPVGSELTGAFQTWVAPVLATLDERLADALDAAGNAAEPAERAKLAADARTVIGEYQSYLASEPRIKELDDNPFVPLSIRDGIGATLNTLAHAIG